MGSHNLNTTIASVMEDYGYALKTIQALRGYLEFHPSMGDSAARRAYCLEACYRLEGLDWDQTDWDLATQSLGVELAKAVLTPKEDPVPEVGLLLVLAKAIG